MLDIVLPKQIESFANDWLLLQMLLHKWCLELLKLSMSEHPRLAVTHHTPEAKHPSSPSQSSSHKASNATFRRKVFAVPCERALQRKLDGSLCPSEGTEVGSDLAEDMLRIPFSNRL